MHVRGGLAQRHSLAGVGVHNAFRLSYAGRFPSPRGEEIAIGRFGELRRQDRQQSRRSSKLFVRHAKLTPTPQRTQARGLTKINSKASEVGSLFQKTQEMNYTAGPDQPAVNETAEETTKATQPMKRRQ
jgi:hypothetical protein